jgi:tetratricopeptide (TPR) repeat protein
MSDLIKGNQLMRIGKLEEAVVAYQKAIAHDPSFHHCHQQLGKALEKLGRRKEAVEAYKLGIEVNGKYSFSYEKLAKLLLETGQLDDAEKMYRTAIKLNPFFHGFHYDIARVLFQKNDLKNAVKELEVCIHKNPKHYPSYDLMGYLLIKQGREDDLIELYKQGLLAMRHHQTDYQKIRHKISDLGLDRDKILNDSFFKNLEIVSDFWEQHRPIYLKNEWVVVEAIYYPSKEGWSTQVSLNHLILAKNLQKLFGYRIAAWMPNFNYSLKQTCICFGVEKFIIPSENPPVDLTENQKSQLGQFLKEANEDNFKHLMLNFNCDNFHVGDLAYDLHIRVARLSTPILDKNLITKTESVLRSLNFWSNLFRSCQAKFFISSHATIYDRGHISRLLCAKKGIVLFPQVGVLRRYETLAELYDHPRVISQKLFLYFWNHHRKNSAQIGKQLLENTMGIKKSSHNKPYHTKAYAGKKVYTRIEFCEQLNLDSSLPIVIVASHVFNDSPHAFHHRLFVDYYEWLVETLKICDRIQSVNWIVKEHPSVGDVSMGFNVDRTAKKLVNSEYSLSKHIKLAPNNLSNLSLIDFCHAIVTISGTISHELASFGIPSILAGSSIYSECDFTYNPQTMQEYTNFLYSIHELPKLTQEQIERCYVAYAIVNHHIKNCTSKNFEPSQDIESTIENWASKIKSNKMKPLEEDQLCKNFMIQMLLKEKHLLRFDELLGLD